MEAVEPPQVIQYSQDYPTTSPQQGPLHSGAQYPVPLDPRLQPSYDPHHRNTFPHYYSPTDPRHSPSIDSIYQHHPDSRKHIPSSRLDHSGYPDSRYERIHHHRPVIQEAKLPAHTHTSGRTVSTL